MINKKKRTIRAFADIDKFYDTLQDRLHVALRNFGYVSGRYKYTLWINAVPRKETLDIDRSQIPDLIYAGTKQQRWLLEEGSVKEETNENWIYLQNTELKSAGAKVSSELYKSIVTKSLTIKKILEKSIGQLKDYFLSVTNPEKTQSIATERQKNEYPIISKNLAWKDYWYISVPLIGFAEFDGIVHIIMHKKDIKIFKNLKADGSFNWDIERIGNIIKLFSWEYENLILDWDVVGKNKYETSLLPVVVASLKQLKSKEFWKETEKRSPILKNLKYARLYETNAWYYYQRFFQNLDVTRTIYDQQLKNAITAILVDSYAHNVSAHSLTALSWWFRKRAQWRSGSGKGPGKGTIEADIETLRAFAHPSTKLNLNYLTITQREAGRIADDLEALFSPKKVATSETHKSSEEKDNSVINYKGSLAREIQPLIGFLAEKGAFWSGVTRDENFGGEVKDLFSVLWYDFINNPLYLGTIAKTEDITHIRLKIVVYEPEVKRLPNGIISKQVLEAGEFAYLNILSPPANYDPVKEDGDKKVYYVDLPGGESLEYGEYGTNRADGQNFAELQDRSRYVQPGDAYSGLKKRLQECMVFFPGGVVGRHAFFTIIENEIRNIKHYSGDTLLKAQREGLTLTLSVQPYHLRKKSSEHELYQIGVWLDIPTKLSQSVRADESPHLIRRKHLSLYQSIMHPSNYMPFLGGNYQDKVCAAMLFNNTFSSVQRGDDDPRRLGYIPDENDGELSIETDESLSGREIPKDSPRDKEFYPWIRVASSLATAPHDDFELKGKPLEEKKEENDRQFTKIYPHNEEAATGLTKKYFYLWKGANIRRISNSQSDWEWENSSRFRLLQIAPSEWAEQWTKARRDASVIRIIEQPDSDNTITSEQEKFKIAYAHWLQKWLSAESYSIFCIEKTGERTQHLFSIYFDGSANLPTFRYSKNAFEEAHHHSVIYLAHKGTSNDDAILRFRSHGIFNQYFQNPELAQSGPEFDTRWLEFLEMWKTKICIFDNRIRHRIRDDNHYNQILKNININVYNENLEDWVNDRTTSETGESISIKEQIKNCHFLVMHLTFVDNILRNQYAKENHAEESRLGIFIEREILPLIQDKPGGEIRKNFIFVITTGRGRKDWWDFLKNSETYQQYTEFTLFRPVESIISGIESAVGKEDDIELKYNLVKVMFGS